MIGRTLGHYRIVEKLGEGGMGVVYLAQDTRLGRNVALKLLPQEALANPDSRARFEREAKVVAALSHPNIVTLYAVEEDEDIRYLTMELVDGKTLDELTPRQGFDPQQLLRIAVPLADAVAAAHLRGITHRDLKPGNVMVTKDGRVKVLDFGLAKALADDKDTQLHGIPKETLTREGRVVGTLAYMAPEQLQGKPLDARVDVFALGVVLFEMATGTRPFQGQNSADLISAVLRDEPPQARRLKPELPSGVGDVIMRCLEKLPEARYATAAQLRDALSAAQMDIASEEILRRASTRPSGWSLTRLVPRGRLWRWAGAGAAVTALALGAWWLARRPQAAELGVAPAAVVARATPAIVVLPLRNYAGEPEYFVDGATDGVIAALARLSGVRVISRQSAMHYKGSTKLLPEIARELRVDYILEGTVERSGDSITLSVSLLRADPEEQLWSDQLSRPAPEVFALHSELARAVAAAAQFPVSPGDVTRLASARKVAPAVYEAYLRGYFLTDQMSEQSFRDGQASFLRAIELDPSFAPAYAALADAYAIEGYLFSDPKTALAKSEEYVQRALELDPEGAEGHATLAYIRHLFRWEWAGAESEYLRALELNPNYAPAHRRYWALLELLGRHEEAGRQIRRAFEIDPLSPNTNANLAMHLIVGGQYEEALRKLDADLRRWPGDGPSLWYRWQLLELMEAPEGERRTALRALLPGMGYPAAVAAFDAAQSGDYRSQVRAVAASIADLAPKQRVLPTLVAELFLLAGDDASALAWLERGVESRSPDLAFFPIHPRWRGVLAKPGFEKVFSALRVPAAPRA
ncbi:MAG TPA: protein kinase [Kofleriaceae bacterium]